MSIIKKDTSEYIKCKQCKKYRAKYVINAKGVCIVCVRGVGLGR